MCSLAEAYNRAAITLEDFITRLTAVVGREVLIKALTTADSNRQPQVGRQLFQSVCMNFNRVYGVDVARLIHATGALLRFLSPDGAWYRCAKVIWGARLCAQLQFGK